MQKFKSKLLFAIILQILTMSFSINSYSQEITEPNVPIIITKQKPVIENQKTDSLEICLIAANSKIDSLVMVIKDAELRAVKEKSDNNILLYVFIVALIMINIAQLVVILKHKKQY